MYTDTQSDYNISHVISWLVIIKCIFIVNVAIVKICSTFCFTLIGLNLCVSCNHKVHKDVLCVSTQFQFLNYFTMQSKCRGSLLFFVNGIYQSNVIVKDLLPHRDIKGLGEKWACFFVFTLFMVFIDNTNTNITSFVCKICKKKRYFWHMVFHSCLLLWFFFLVMTRLVQL